MATTVKIRFYVFFAGKERHTASILVSTMSPFGRIDEFKPENEPCSAYIEPLEQFSEANDVAVGVTVATTCGLQRNLSETGRRDV